MDSYRLVEERAGERVPKSGEKRVKTTQKITANVFILSKTEIFLHADSRREEGIDARDNN